MYTCTLWYIVNCHLLGASTGLTDSTSTVSVVEAHIENEAYKPTPSPVLKLMFNGETISTQPKKNTYAPTWNHPLVL